MPVAIVRRLRVTSLIDQAQRQTLHASRFEMRGHVDTGQRGVGLLSRSPEHVDPFVIPPYRTCLYTRQANARGPFPSLEVARAMWSILPESTE